MPTKTQAKQRTRSSDRVSTETPHELSRRLSLFDGALMLFGGVIGSSIFVLPALIAQQVHGQSAILGVWLFGGLLSLCGILVHVALAKRFPHVGGQYVYLREAYPAVLSFLYCWSMLLVTQTGAIASVAIVCSRYFISTTNLSIPIPLITALAICIPSAINCLGVALGSTALNILTALKIILFLLILFGGLLFAAGSHAVTSAAPSNSVAAFSNAIILVMFSYGGAHRLGFVAGEVVKPNRNLPRALLFGFSGVIVAYLMFNFVCLYVLGEEGLRSTSTPALEVMKKIAGSRGANLMGIGIVLSAVGWLMQVTFTAPRVYFALARDGLFFDRFGHVNPFTGTPVMAICLQALLATIIAMTGTYEQILRYVVSVDIIFFALTAYSIFIFRKGARTTVGSADAGDKLRPVGHPWTTVIVILFSGWVAFSLFLRNVREALIGFGIVAAGVPVYFVWRSRNKVLRAR